MTGLSRCGKRYPDMASAVKAAEARTFKSVLRDHLAVPNLRRDMDR